MAVYAIMGAPPLETGAEKETVAASGPTATATPIIGAPGAVMDELPDVGVGVGELAELEITIGVLGAEGGEVPAPFVAVTVKV